MSLPRLIDFDRVVFFTGAGLSAESGVPTYRGAGGIWKAYDHARYACQEAFLRDPAGVWEFHNHRRSLVAPCEPHVGHAIITAACARSPAARVITQNIDGMHQQAGTRDVIELHGSLWRIRCDACGARRASREAPLIVLRCACGAWWRPDIVWFGDHLDHANLHAAEEALRSCDLLISVGTSAVVHPAADLPAIAARRGAVCVEVNPEPTPVSHLYHHHLRATAGEALLALNGGHT
jgi:NAD-dependent deacetylase